MLIFWVITIFISLFYSITILILRYGWGKTKKYYSSVYKGSLFVSVIIPMRNEENNIGNILNDITSQDISEKNYEIIVVDDHSTDNSCEIVLELCNKNPNISLLNLPDKDFGKKKAIACGIDNAKANLIVTTDVDCRIKDTWLSTILSFYEIHKPKMMICPVEILPDKTLFSKLQSLEFASLTGSAAGATGINRPIMCNGANLVFEKEIFRDCKNKLPEETISGDDVFLMLAIKKLHRDKILFLKSDKSIVYTKPQATIREFIQQRIRWTSKSRYYSDIDIIFTASMVLIMNIFLLLSIIGIFVNFSFFPIFIYLFVLKTIIDLIFLYPVVSFFKKRKLLAFLIPLQLIYPVYISFTGILGNIVRFRWKGRRYRS